MLREVSYNTDVYQLYVSFPSLLLNDKRSRKYVGFLGGGGGESIKRHNVTFIYL